MDAFETFETRFRRFDGSTTPLPSKPPLFFRRGLEGKADVALRRLNFFECERRQEKKVRK